MTKKDGLLGFWLYWTGVGLWLLLLAAGFVLSLFGGILYLVFGGHKYAVYGCAGGLLICLDAVALFVIGVIIDIAQDDEEKKPPKLSKR